MSLALEKIKKIKKVKVPFPSIVALDRTKVQSCYMLLCHQKYPLSVNRSNWLAVQNISLQLKCYEINKKITLSAVLF